MRQKKKTEELLGQQGELFAGDVLRSKRREMKLSIDQISKELCIRAKYLTALEEKDYKVFPAMTYTYGFLRTYAEFLGLDADELVQKVKFFARKAKSVSVFFRFKRGGSSDGSGLFALACIFDALCL